MAYQIQLRNDVANNWTRVNPILAQAEAGYENDTGFLKFGDGVTPWTSLPYFSTGGGNGGGTPGGVNGSIQYNNNGAFGGSGLFQIDVANSLMTITGNVNAGYFVGDGSQLTNLPTSNLANITGNLIPSANGIYSLGNATNQWKDLWVTSNTIFIDTIPIGLNGNADLTFNGNPLVTAEGNTGVTNVQELSVQGNIGANNIAADEMIATGNIQANYIWANNYVYANAFIGEGGNLSNINAANIVGAYSNANVADYLPGYAGNIIVEELAATANISAQYYFGNIVYTTGGFGNANVAEFLPTYTGNLSANNISVANNFAVHGDASISGNLNVAGNTVYTNTSSLTVDNPIIVAGANNVSDIIDQGLLTPFNNGTQQYGGFIRDHLNGTWNLFANVTTLPNTTVDFGNATYVPLRAGTFIGDGGNLSNINAANIVGDIALSNANVAGSMTVGGNLTANGNITTSGAVVASYLVGDGSNITNIPYSAIVGGYGNANVAAYLPSYTGALNSLAGNVVTTANIRGANIIASGNVYSQYVYGNGAFLTGITAGTSYSNANVAAFLPNNTSNVAAAYFIGDGSLLTNISSGYSNANVAAYLPTYTGNVQAGSFTTGNTGLFIAGNTITTHNSNLILDPGFDGLTGGTVYIQGNLNVTGNTSYTNVTVATTSNLVWQAAYDATAPIQADGGGLAVGPVANSYASFLYDVSTNAWISSIAGTFTGNLTADYLKGDGGYISNIQYANVIGGYGDANVAAYLPTNTADVGAGNVTVTGTTYTYNLSSTGTANLTLADVIGNLTAGAVLTDNYLYANGVPVSFGGGSDYSNANVAAYLPGYGGDIAANTVTGNYFYGDGSNLTGLPASYGNADVAAYLPTYAGNILGNVITANYYFGDGGFLSNVSNYSNADVAAYLPTYTGVITADVVTANILVGDGGNISNIQYSAIAGSYSNANVADYLATYTGDITTNNITATTVTATYLYGDGSNLTGMYADANVAAFLPTYTGDITGGNVTLTNDVTARYFIGDGGYLSNVQYSNLIGAYSNANVADYLPTYTGLATAGNVAVTGNVTADGTVQAQQFTAGTGNILVSGTSITTTTPNIVIDPGNDGLSGGNLIVQGNLQVAGNVTYVNTSTVTTDNLIWQAANTATNPLLADGGGLAVGPAGNSYATWLYSATDDLWVSNLGVEINGGANIAGNVTGVTNITATGSVSANSFVGDGGHLSNIQYSNLVGAYGDSNVAAYLPTFTGNLTAGNASVTDTVFAHYFVGDGGTLSNINYANVTGAYGNSNVAAYLPTNTSNVSAAHFIGDGSLLTGMYANANVAQYLPTYTGALANLTGNVTTVANIQGQYLLGNGAFITGLPTQYSNANVAAYLPTYTGDIAANSITVTSVVTAGAFAGDGGYLSNVQYSNLIGAYSNANVANYLPTNTSNIAGRVLTVSAVSLGAGNVQVSNNIIYSTTANIVIDPGNDGLSGGNLIVQGNLQVKGNVTYVNTSTVTTDNLVWQAANTATTPLQADGGGLAVGPAGNSYATWLYSATDNIWVSSVGVEINGNANITNISTSSLSANSFSASSVNTTSITAGTISGDGGNISNIQYNNIAGAYGDANVAAYLPTYNGDIGANVITANYFYGDGSNLTGLPASYSNADVAAYLPTYTGNITAFDITTSNAVTAGNVILNTNGSLVFSDGTSMSSAPAAIPAMYFTAAANANNQVFSNTFIASYTDPTDMTVFINGAMLEATYYTMVGSNLTINLPLTTGDSVDIARSFAGNVISSYYPTNSIDFNSANQTLISVSGLAARWLGEAGQVQLSVLSGSGVAHVWTGTVSQSSGGLSAVNGSASLSAGSWTALNSAPVLNSGDSLTVNIVNTADNKVYQLIAVYAGNGGSITLTQIA